MLEQNQLATNSDSNNFYLELTNAFTNCIGFKINVAFVSFSGLQLLLDTLQKAKQLGIRGNVITSTYLNFTDPKAIQRIADFDNIDLRIFVSQREQGFHPKSYLFEYADHFKIFIGSSNLTQTALKSNIEWNVKTISKQSAFTDSVYAEFDRLWDISEPASKELIGSYARFIASLKKSSPQHKIYQYDKALTPNEMQYDAMKNLHRLRSYGENKALVIAATGSGKTYMAAFDTKQSQAKKLLFIVHRENILCDAMDSFMQVMGQTDACFGMLTGNQQDFHADFLFATNLSAANHLDKFSRDHFDYIVVDEAHHVSASSYQKILAHFDPAFTLGMTATPERGDASSIYEVFDNNIATEVRLREALDRNLIVPFHYFGIADAAGIDYEGVNLNRIEDVAKLLKTNFRVEYILSQIEFYGYEGDKLKGVGFCANIDHAEFMADAFNQAGIESLALTGQSIEKTRRDAMTRLQSDEQSLQMIFTVDIFNEGINIPTINLVLMLRPTASPIIFLQQLGRGLRKHPDKTFLTVLDFIGNHNRAFLVAIALYGNQYFDKDSLKVAVSNNFISIPGCTHISLDEVSKEQILAQLETEHFSSMKYLREEYLNFKLACGNKVPTLQHYLTIDGAPDPIKFIRNANSYIGFLLAVEKNDERVQQLAINIDFMKLYRFISDHLPAKRIAEMIILRELIARPTLSIQQAAEALARNGYTYTNDGIQFAFEYLSGEYFDSVDKKKYLNIGTYERVNNSDLSTYHVSAHSSVDDASFLSGHEQIQLDTTSQFSASDDLMKAVVNSDARAACLDAISYATGRFNTEFGLGSNNIDFLSLYKQYNMRDVAFVSQYKKMHSSYRGQGVCRNGNDLFLFIELHKEEKAIAYNDKFISPSQFQWDSPNTSRPDSGQGFDILNHEKLGLKLHLFVRKFKKIDNVTQAYIYIGQASVVSHECQKPITMQMALKNTVPMNIYDELISSS